MGCGDFDPTPHNILFHTYHETVLYRCEMCGAIMPEAQMITHRHKKTDLLPVFLTVRLFNVPAAVREKKCWLWSKRGVEKMVLEMPVNAPQTVPEGKHFGAIDKLEVRDFTNKKGEEAQYLDVHLTCEGEQAKPKAGYPANISPSTLLGKLLTRFGAKLEIGGKLDVEKILPVGLKVQYVTSDEDTPNGTFSRVDRKSLRPFKG